MKKENYERIKELMKHTEIEDIEILVKDIEVVNDTEIGYCAKVTYITNLIVEGDSYETYRDHIQYEEWSKGAEDEVAYVDKDIKHLMDNLYEIEYDWIEQAEIDNACGL